MWKRRGCSDRRAGRRNCSTSAARLHASASTCCCGSSPRCAGSGRTFGSIRVGGPFTAEQRALVRDLGLEPFIVVLPFLDRATLAAVYRRSALVLLPSEREGFGLPVLEALACGTPVVASDIDALREVGGDAVQYCPPEDVEAWTTTVARALTERGERPAQWTAPAARRQRAGSLVQLVALHE